MLAASSGEMESDNEGYTGEDERGAKCWERITELTRRLMNTGEVEAVGCSFYSCPYSQGNSWTSVEPAGADSVNAYSESLHRQLGDVGFFEVFGIHDVNGKHIRELENPAKDEVILTEKVAQKFFGGKEPRGRLVNTGRWTGRLYWLLPLLFVRMILNRLLPRFISKLPVLRWRSFSSGIVLLHWNIRYA